MLTKGFLSFTQTRFLFTLLIWNASSTESVRLRHSSGMWLLILEWDWSTRSHAQFPPVASKRTSFKRVCLQKRVSACLWRIHDLDSSCSSDKVKWGLRSCSSEQKWSLLHASPSTGSSISRDIASKVPWTQIPGHPLTVGQGAGRLRARSSLTEPDISNSSQKKPC